MNILILGSGGREHALGWKIKQSPKLKKLFFAPGNPGTSELGLNLPVDITSFESVKKEVLENEIDLMVVGPEVPLVEGIHDYFANDIDLQHVQVIGPKKSGAQLEGSKDFAKDFMKRHGIPTAAYLTVTPENLDEGLSFLEKLQPPYVLKADGLAAGKGVLIVGSLAEAQQSLKEMLGGMFGEASRKVVIEEFLTGVEVSVFVLTDGKDYLLLPEAKDYKRIGEGDTGLNTGGMGAISPVPFAGKAFLKKVEETIIQPTIQGIREDNLEYTGFIFFGLMNCNGEPKVIEYNVRMGDPETEAVILRIKSDLLELLEAAAEGTLKEKTIEIDEQSAVTVMLVSGGYPGDFEKGKVISGYDQVAGSLLFHAGTKLEFGKLKTNGGRVIAVSSTGATFHEALKKSYQNAALIEYEKKYFRTDLGFDL
ncbi:MAG TPA: phosphoribosylamine--glycine ligase [Prolixibacteraceae bacterium]|nr:phosphoribosylamine--glycine ligase [Prolixibacteraceae bacterium]